MQGTFLSIYPDKSSYLRVALVFFVSASCIVVLSILGSLQPLSALLWVVMLLSITGPLWFYPTLRRQAFHPYSYLAFSGFVSFAVPGLLVWISHAFGTPVEYFPQAAALIGGAFLACWLGFRSRFGVRLAISVPLLVFPGTDTLRGNYRPFVMALLLYVVGWVGRFIRASIGFSHLPTDLGGMWRYISPLGGMDTFGILGYVFMLYFLLKVPRRRVLSTTVATMLLALEILGGALYGGRSAIVLPGLYLVMVYHFGIRPIQWRTLIVGYALALLVLGPVLTIYRASFYSLQMSGEMPGVQTMLNAISLGVSDIAANKYDWESLLSSNIFESGTSVFQSTLRVLERVPSWYDYQYGGTFIPHLLVAVVPRLLWSDKPLLLPGRDFAIRFWGMEPNQLLGTSIGIGMPAESYYNFSWFGLFIFPLLGAWLRFLWERYQRYKILETTHIVRAFFIIFEMTTITESFLYYITNVIQAGLMYLLFMALVNCRLPIIRRLT